MCTANHLTAACEKMIINMHANYMQSISSYKFTVEGDREKTVLELVSEPLLPLLTVSLLLSDLFLHPPTTSCGHVTHQPPHITQPHQLPEEEGVGQGGR